MSGARGRSPVPVMASPLHDIHTSTGAAWPTSSRMRYDPHKDLRPRHHLHNESEGNPFAAHEPWPMKRDAPPAVRPPPFAVGDDVMPQQRRVLGQVKGEHMSRVTLNDDEDPRGRKYISQMTRDPITHAGAQTPEKGKRPKVHAGAYVDSVTAVLNEDVPMAEAADGRVSPSKRKYPDALVDHVVLTDEIEPLAARRVNTRMSSTVPLDHPEFDAARRPVYATQKPTYTVQPVTQIGKVEAARPHHQVRSNLQHGTFSLYDTTVGDEPVQHTGRGQHKLQSSTYDIIKGDDNDAGFTFAHYVDEQRRHNSGLQFVSAWGASPQRKDEVAFHDLPGAGDHDYMPPARPRKQLPPLATQPVGTRSMQPRGQEVKYADLYRTTFDPRAARDQAHARQSPPPGRGSPSPVPRENPSPAPQRGQRR